MQLAAPDQRLHLHDQDPIGTSYGHHAGMLHLGVSVAIWWSHTASARRFISWLQAVSMATVLLSPAGGAGRLQRRWQRLAADAGCRAGPQPGGCGVRTGTGAGTGIRAAEQPGTASSCRAGLGAAAGVRHTGAAAGPGGGAFAAARRQQRQQRREHHRQRAVCKLLADDGCMRVCAAGRCAEPASSVLAGAEAVADLALNHPLHCRLLHYRHYSEAPRLLGHY